MHSLTVTVIAVIMLALCFAFIPFPSGNGEERQIPSVTGKWTGTASDSILAKQFPDHEYMSLVLVQTRNGEIKGIVTIADPVRLTDVSFGGFRKRSYKLVAEVSASFSLKPRILEVGMANGTWTGEYQGSYVKINFSAIVEGNRMSGTYSSSHDFPDNSLAAALTDLEVKGGTFSLIKD